MKIHKVDSWPDDQLGFWHWKTYKTEPHEIDDNCNLWTADKIARFFREVLHINLPRINVHDDRGFLIIAERGTGKPLFAIEYEEREC